MRQPMQSLDHIAPVLATPVLPALAGARRVVVKIGSALVVEEKTAAPRPPGWPASRPMSRRCARGGPR